MKTSKFLSIVIFVAIISASCSRDDAPATAIEKSGVEVSFTSMIVSDKTTTSARTVASLWDKEEIFGIIMKPSGKEISKYLDIEYYINREGNILVPLDTSESLHIPENEEVDFAAFYPITEPASLFPLPTMKPTIGVLTNVDFLYAEGTTRHTANDPNVNLEFKHMMSKINIVLTAGSGLQDSKLEGISVSVWGISKSGTYHTTDRTFTSNRNATTQQGVSVKMDKNGQYGTVILLPETVDKGYLSFTLKDGTEVKWNIPKSTVFESGKNYTFSVTISKDSKRATVGVDITKPTDWQNTSILI